MKSTLDQTPDLHARLLAACPIAVVAAEPGRVVHANPAALGLIGVADQVEIAAKELVDFFHPDDRAAVAAWLGSSEPVRPALEARVVRADGSVRYVEATSATVPVASGSTVLVTMQDVTERRRASAETRNRALAQQQQQRFADIAAVATKVVHDVANPVAGLIMGTQRVLQLVDRMPADAAAPLRPSVERVLDTARSLEALLQEFRDFVDAQRPELQTVRLAPFLAEARAEWGPDAAARGAVVSFECRDDLEVRADRGKLRRALDNLLKNAIDAIGGGPGEIRVTARPAGRSTVSIAVRDTGPGVPVGMDPFALFATTKADGTGLGLPSARQLVEAQGGTIRLIDDGWSAGGACFEIELPAPRR